jgi:hypothetical protein
MGAVSVSGFLNLGARGTKERRGLPMEFKFSFEIGDRLEGIFQKLLGVLSIGCNPSTTSMKGASFMFIVPDNQADVNYLITPPTEIKDAEGFPVSTEGLSYEVTSDNESAVKVTPDPADPTRGTVSFGGPNADGSPALANINALVKSQGGAVLGSFGAQFTVTAGDAAQILGGSLSFDGLSEAQPAERIESAEATS